jgi:hypothetical protein
LLKADCGELDIDWLHNMGFMCIEDEGFVPEPLLKRLRQVRKEGNHVLLTIQQKGAKEFMSKLSQNQPDHYRMLCRYIAKQTIPEKDITKWLNIPLFMTKSRQFKSSVEILTPPQDFPVSRFGTLLDDLLLDPSEKVSTSRLVNFKPFPYPLTWEDLLAKVESLRSPNYEGVFSCILSYILSESCCDSKNQPKCLR